MSKIVTLGIVFSLIFLVLLSGYIVYMQSIRSQVPEQAYIMDTKIDYSLLSDNSINIYIEFIAEFSHELSFHNLSLVQYSSNPNNEIVFQPDRDVLLINNFTYGNYQIYQNRVTNSLNVTFKQSTFVMTPGSFNLILDLSYSTFFHTSRTVAVFVINVE